MKPLLNTIAPFSTNDQKYSTNKDSWFEDSPESPDSIPERLFVCYYNYRNPENGIGFGESAFCRLS